MDSLIGVGVVPLILGVVEAIKRLGVPSQFAPLISVVVGVAITLFTTGTGVESVINGVLLGLSASGLWSGGKVMLGK